MKSLEPNELYVGPFFLDGNDVGVLKTLEYLPNTSLKGLLLVKLDEGFASVWTILLYWWVKTAEFDVDALERENLWPLYKNAMVKAL